MAVKSRTSKLRKIDVCFLKCRTIGHAWRWTTVTRAGQKYVQHLRCTSCDTTKRQELDSRGFIVSNSYTYPEGYRVSGLGSLDRDDRASLRLRFISGSGT